MPLHLLHLYHCWAAQRTGNWEEERSTGRTDSGQESYNLKTPKKIKKGTSEMRPILNNLQRLYKLNLCSLFVQQKVTKANWLFQSFLSMCKTSYFSEPESNKCVKIYRLKRYRKNCLNSKSFYFYYFVLFDLICLILITSPFIKKVYCNISWSRTWCFYIFKRNLVLHCIMSN